ncbi:MAG: serine/threonine-protein kinase [Myxococcota bacterium]
MVRTLPALCQFGRYELLGRIAVGGMAEIFLARERENVAGAGDRHLVIKRVLSHVADNETFQSMFFDEARLAMRLQHPAIVHIYEFGEESGSTFLAMEWVEGIALGKLIRRAREHGGIPPAVAVKIAATVAEALHYAHRVRCDDGQALGIVHRDVSPQNLMISYEGSVKLLDFGIAKATDQMSRTSDGQVKGKFAYMAPEQCVGDPVDARSDVFALGVCLYEALTGRPLYHRKTQYETMRAVLEDAVPMLNERRAGLPDDLDAIVRKAIAKDAADRYQSAGEFQVALEHWLALHQEIVPATRIAEFVSRVVGEGPKSGQIDSTPFGQSFRGSIPSAPPLAVIKSTPPPRSSAPPPPPNAGPDGSSLTELSASELISEDEERLIDPSTGALAVVEPETRSKGPRPWLVFGMLLVVASVAVAWYFAEGRGETAAVAVAPPAATAPGAVNMAEGSVPRPVEGTNAPAERTNAPAVVGEGDSPAPVADLRVRSRPAGADVFVDGAPRGQTPLELAGLPSGAYAVRIVRAGYEPWEGSAQLVAGQPLTLDRRLRRVRRSSARARAEMATEAEMTEMSSAARASMANTAMASTTMEPMATAGPAGELAVNTRPWSRVYVGSRLLGTTPLGGVELPSGSVRLRFEDRDGETHVRTVRVRPGQVTRQFFDFSE